MLRRSGNIKTEGCGEGAWHSVDVGLQHNACKIFSINCMVGFVALRSVTKKVCNGKASNGKINTGRISNR